MTDSQLQTVTFNPGINTNTTEYLAGENAGWVECDKVRFSDGRAQKIGGWIAQPTKNFEDPDITNLTVGAPRDMITWTGLNRQKYITVAGHKKVELIADNVVYDLTPTRKEFRLDPGPGTLYIDDSRYESILQDIITTVTGSTQITFNIPSHNAEVGDFIYINSVELDVGGITIPTGTFSVISVPDENNFVIDIGIAAASDETGGGKIFLDLLLECGLQNNISLIGYGGGTWNTPGINNGGYNTPRGGGEFGVPLRQWSLDNWGEDLIATVSGGEMYHWDASRTNARENRLQTLENRLTDPGSGSDPNPFYEADDTIREEKIKAIPTKNSFSLVTVPSRILVSFGSVISAGPEEGQFDPLLIRWSDIGDFTDWRILKTNSAGEFRMPKGNRIVSAHQTRNEIIIFTDEEAFSMVFVGGPDVFRFEPLGTNMSAVGLHSVIDVNGVIFWMGVDDFYMYDGTIRPMPNTLDDLLFDQDGEAQLDQNQKEKVYAGLNKKFHEIWWFYPKKGALEDPTNIDINNYVVYNYLEGVWYYGTMPRSVWVDRGTFSSPLAVGNEDLLFSHEQGKNDNGEPLVAFIRSGYFDVADGTELMFVDRILPDLELPGLSTIKISVLTKIYPHPNAKIITKGPYLFSDADDKISFRARGRQISIKYEVDELDQDFEIGKVRIGARLDGARG